MARQVTPLTQRYQTLLCCTQRCLLNLADDQAYWKISGSEKWLKLTSQSKPTYTGCLSPHQALNITSATHTLVYQFFSTKYSILSVTHWSQYFNHKRLNLFYLLLITNVSLFRMSVGRDMVKTRSTVQNMICWLGKRGRWVFAPVIMITAHTILEPGTS